MKKILLTPFNYKYMHLYRKISILFAVFVLCTITYVLESVYSYKLTTDKEEYASSGELLSETKFFYNIEPLDISNIKKYNFKIIDNKMVGDLAEESLETFSYSFKYENIDYSLTLVFDIHDIKIDDNLSDLYEKYEIEKNANSFIFVFSSDSIYYHSYGKDLNVLSYDYLYFDIDKVDNLNDLGKIIALSFTQVYIDYKVSEFTVICLVCTIVFPIILTWVIFKFIGSRVKYQTFKEFLNIMVFSSIVPFIIVIIGTLFNEKIIYFYDILLFAFMLYNILKISNDTNLEYKNVE